MTFLPPNTVVQDRYLIIRKIGEGGMGAVYEAKDQRLGHRVALKQTIISDEGLERAFEHEARMLARLDHPTLPHVSDYFRAREGQFLVMKYIAGDDLESLLYKQQQPFSVEKVVAWMFELLDALDYLHAHSPPIIHRDIKPANLKLSAQGKIILLDFGISKGGGSDQTRFTTGKSIYAFTPYYAPLEQINAQGTDERSDIYSLAATFYHLLTATELPTAATRAGAQITHSADPLRPANQLNPQVPVGLANLLAQAMALNPAQRPQSASAMRAALQAIRGNPLNRSNFGREGSQTGGPEQFPRTVVAPSPYSQTGAPEQFPKTVVSRPAGASVPPNSGREGSRTGGSNYMGGGASAGGVGYGYGQQQAPPPYYPNVPPHASPREPEPAPAKSKPWLPIAILSFLGIAIVGFLLFIVLDPFADKSEPAVAAITPQSTVTRRVTETAEAPVVEPTSTEEAPVIEPSSTEEAPVVEPTSTEAAVVEPTSTEAAVVEPTSTEAPVVEPTSTEAAVVEPTSTEAPLVEPTLAPDIPDGTTRFSQKDGMEIIFVSAGEFLMGSLDDDPLANDHEKPQHRVYLDGFWIDQTEVTNAMFARFVEDTGHETFAEQEGRAYVYDSEDHWFELDGANWQHPRGPESNLDGLEAHPVIHVSWNDAEAYCEWAGRRLPTEAEWEKAARGSDGRIYPWGNEEAAGNRLNFCDSNCPLSWADNNTDDSYEFTAPVESYPDGASPVGTLDMTGNVWEWVADWYDEDYYRQSPEENPQGPDNGIKKVLRGGSWSAGADWERAAFRLQDPPTDPNDERGFRCASDP